jgi:hypothetical protein
MLAKSSSKALRRSRVSDYQREELKQLIKSSDHAKYSHTVEDTPHQQSVLGLLLLLLPDTSTDGFSETDCATGLAVSRASRAS